MSDDWIACTKELPRDGEVVETKIDMYDETSRRIAIRARLSLLLQVATLIPVPLIGGIGAFWMKHHGSSEPQSISAGVALELIGLAVWSYFWWSKI